jgi:hypothetical protein
MFLLTLVAIASSILEAYHVPENVFHIFIGLDNVVSLGIIQLGTENVTQTDVDLSI